MSEITFTEAFAKYGAVLSNRQWSFSAIAPDGALVISCWQHKIKTAEGLWRYSDCLSRFKQSNAAGRNEFIKHLRQAYDEKLRVRLIIVIVSPEDAARVDAGEDASGLRKTFHVREDYVGEIETFDGDAYTIAFKKTPKPQREKVS